MDGRKAFDTVWHRGMLYKLLETDNDPTWFLAFRAMYSNMSSCVRYQNKHSKWFDVLQGTRQGGQSSPLLYLLYINGLISTIEKSGAGFLLYDTKVCSPTVSDDMLLVSFSVQGLNAMLNICDKYSKQWQYQYNPSKCAVVVFNEHTNGAPNRMFKLGDHTIKEASSYVHLGIKCNQFLEAGTMVDDACNKLRGTYLSLVNSGLSPLSLNPSISIKVYKTVVIPKALYGSELWSSMTPADLRKLEHSHRFCLKHMQGLPRRTPTNFTLSAINAVPLETVIDHKN